ncbi:hypothetical protein L6164_017231 [Bauhinia variegata]|uniref:Uncharacterized protein n=1 Tax=Bauhinia variegata TaxID=167791 RepID=A0ACB9N7A5_BAUVA|nr:hypothetical protein L6164_017231 [Bauhinia variegata]
MASETKPWLMLLLFAATFLQRCVHGWPQVPCLFIFGDSSSDPGNNNNLAVSSRVNYPPYGVDFPKGVTGRYNNGKTTIDQIGELLGLTDFIPAYADYQTPFTNRQATDVYFGVNYASAGGGLDDFTSSSLGKIFSLTDQINQHKSIYFQIAAALKSEEQAKEHLEKCLYYLDLGTNDYVINYFVTDFYNTSQIYTPEEWALHLIKRYYDHLTELHKFSARKFALSGLGFLGCRPHQRNSKGECDKNINDALTLFNNKLPGLVDKLNEDYPDSQFMYVNYPAIQTSVFDDFINDAGCCVADAFFGLCVVDPIIA